MRSFSILVTLVCCSSLLARADIELPEKWEFTSSLVGPEIRDVEPSRAQKDPSLVKHDGQWHVFMTVKLPGRSAIEYCSFEKWEDANAPKGLCSMSVIVIASVRRRSSILSLIKSGIWSIKRGCPVRRECGLLTPPRRIFLIPLHGQRLKPCLD